MKVNDSAQILTRHLSIEKQWVAKIFCRFYACFNFIRNFFRIKFFFFNFCFRRLKSMEQIFKKYTVDLNFSRNRFPLFCWPSEVSNLNIEKKTVFFHNLVSICRIIKLFFHTCKDFVFTFLLVPIIISMCIDLHDPQNAKKQKKKFQNVWISRK